MNPKLQKIERHRRKIWGLCYRMTGRRDSADDLMQETFARAVERVDQQTEEGEEHLRSWVCRIATTICLDWLRHKKVENERFTLVDPIDFGEDGPFSLSSRTHSDDDAEARLVRRDDVRFAVVASLQALSADQRAVLILRDVLEFSTEETATILDVQPGNVKVLLHRARTKLEETHHVGLAHCDAPVDEVVVEKFATSLERGDIDGLIKLLAPNVWGIVDDGEKLRKPTFGAHVVGRQWMNALQRFGAIPRRIDRVRLNGEPALVVSLGDHPFASIHLETNESQVVSVRVLRDARRLGNASEAGPIDL
jgi:RNA polymerase sigma factor (sigma-70 family)